jgi:hypothetical protein
MVASTKVIVGGFGGPMRKPSNTVHSRRRGRPVETKAEVWRNDMKPICVKCRRFYRPKKNGTYFVEGKPRGGVRAPPGLEAPELWEHYKLWLGDLWECRGCGSEIIVGTGINPVSRDYMPDFEKDIATTGAATITINDC